MSDNNGAVRVGVISYATFIENAVVLGDYSSKAELQVWLNNHNHNYYFIKRKIHRIGALNWYTYIINK